MTTKLGYDSTHPISLDALRNNGASAVGRYIGNFRKAASFSEIHNYLNGGFGVWLIWESTADRALKGYAAGAEDAKRANTAAALLGAPTDVFICWTVDTDANPKDVLSYARGWANNTHHPAAVYGSAGVIDICIEKQLVRTGWQTNARGWDRPRRYSTHATMWQHLSTSPVGVGSVDPNNFIDSCPMIWKLHNKPDMTGPQWPGTLARGDRSYGVAQWAFILHSCGYRGFIWTGEGADSFQVGKINATRRFQKNHGIPVTGKVDKVTWDKGVALAMKKGSE